MVKEKYLAQYKRKEKLYEKWIIKKKRKHLTDKERKYIVKLKISWRTYQYIANEMWRSLRTIEKTVKNSDEYNIFIKNKETRPMII